MKFKIPFFVVAILVLTLVSAWTAEKETDEVKLAVKETVEASLSLKVDAVAKKSLSEVKSKYEVAEGAIEDLVKSLGETSPEAVAAKAVLQALDVRRVAGEEILTAPSSELDDKKAAYTATETALVAAYNAFDVAL